MYVAGPGITQTIKAPYSEDIWANLRQLREQEMSFQSFAADYAALKRSREVLAFRFFWVLAN